MGERTGARGPRDDPVARIVREHDRDRFVSLLFAPEDVRPALFALFAFAAELARVPASVSDPALGEIRLQFWRDEIEAAVAGRGAGHPVGQALAPDLRAGLIDRDRLLAMVNARAADLYADPVETWAALEAYFGATLSLPIRSAIRILGGPETDIAPAADAAGHAGVALGLTRMLTHFPATLARRPELLPVEVLDRAGTSAAALAGGGDAANRVMTELAGAARTHLAAAAAAARLLPKPTLPALLPLAPLKTDLARIRRRRDPVGQIAAAGPLRRQIAIWRAAATGRIA